MIDSMPVCGKKAFGRSKGPDGKTAVRWAVEKGIPLPDRRKAVRKA